MTRVICSGRASRAVNRYVNQTDRHRKLITPPRAAYLRIRDVNNVNDDAFHYTSRPLPSGSPSSPIAVARNSDTFTMNHREFSLVQKGNAEI